MYKITIERTDTVKKLVGKDWAVIGTKEEPREQGFYMHDKTEPSTRIVEVWGYTPEIEKGVQMTSTILTQEVETLNLADVIKAINGL